MTDTYHHIDHPKARASTGSKRGSWNAGKNPNCRATSGVIDLGETS